jgi:predicted O-methyltransferase YrrM
MDIMHFQFRKRFKHDKGLEGIGLISFLDPLIREYDWSHFPFNGQLLRAKKILELFERVECNWIVETGTYLGSTTEYLMKISKIGIHSIEKNQTFYEAARARFELIDVHNQINLIHGDSAIELKNLLPTDNFQKNIIFAYLDAHWDDELPLRAELLALKDSKLKFIAVIDDFRIPNERYGFDTFDGKPINSYVDDLLDDLDVWVPSISAIFESGAKRGTAYVFSPHLAKKMPRVFFGDLKRYNRDSRENED